MESDMRSVHHRACDRTLILQMIWHALCNQVEFPLKRRRVRRCWPQEPQQRLEQPTDAYSDFWTWIEIAEADSFGPFSDTAKAGTVIHLIPSRLTSVYHLTQFKKKQLDRHVGPPQHNIYRTTLLSGHTSFANGRYHLKNGQSPTSHDHPHHRCGRFHRSAPRRNVDGRSIGHPIGSHRRAGARSPFDELALLTAVARPALVVNRGLAYFHIPCAQSAQPT